MFKPIDAKYPDFARTVPAKISGEPGAYKWQYMADFDACTEIAFGARFSVELYPNGTKDTALVLQPSFPNFIGVIMPMRANNPAESPALPIWWTGKPELKVAA